MSHQAGEKNTGLHSGATEARLSLAFIAGRRTGLLELPPQFNEYPSGTPEHEQWAQGHQSAQSTLLKYRPSACVIATRPAPEHTLESTEQA